MSLPARIVATLALPAAFLLTPAEALADACCAGDLTCTDVATAWDCDGWGTYLAGETCALVDCSAPRSCCGPGGCQDVPPGSCAWGAVPGAAGSTCAAINCAAQACCTGWDVGGCVDVSPFTCETQFYGHPEGPGSTCADADACAPRTCCGWPDCEMLDPFSCLMSPGRTPGEPGSTCQAGCPTPCCLPDGACTTVLEGECAVLGGISRPDMPCVAYLCPQRISCCLPEGGCAEVAADECALLGGVPSQVPHGPCAIAGCPPAEACCLATQDCEELSWPACVARGGRPAGGGLTCASVTDCADLPVPGRVPASLTVRRDPAGTQLLLEWDASCSPSVSDHAVYRGEIGRWYSHGRMQCSTSGLTSTRVPLSPALRRIYFLIQPLTANVEGSLGTDSMGRERPAAGFPCKPVQNPACP